VAPLQAAPSSSSKNDSTKVVSDKPS
jgi:hypothetical protein